MLKKTIARLGSHDIVLADSITQLDSSFAGSVVVTGSHGGLSAAEFARRFTPALVFFNDAGIGKDNAGIAGLAFLAEHGIAACAYTHLSARIGDAQDGWDNGVVAHVNDPARRLGLNEGETVQAAIRRAFSGR